jgi:hypothetical protein
LETRGKHIVFNEIPRDLADCLQVDERDQTNNAERSGCLQRAPGWRHASASIRAKLCNLFVSRTKFMAIRVSAHPTCAGTGGVSG